MSMNSTIAIPASPATRRWVGWWLVPVIGVIAVGGVALALRPWGGKPPEVQGTFFNIVPMDLEVKITKDGELQAIEYTDIKSAVEGVSQIIELVKEGTTVKKGDKLVVLDSSNLKDRKDDVDINIQKAESALKIAIEMKEIQESQNAANKEAAEVNKRLAKLDLQEYLEGTYPQQVQNAKTSLEMAQITLKNKEEDLAQTQALFAKGFVTATEVKKAELDVTVARNDVQKATTALTVLQKYTNAMEVARLESVMAQADQRYARTLRENASLLTQRLADVAEKESTLTNLRDRAKKLQEQIDNCTMRAPKDGLVIYASTIDRWGPGPIQEGAQVRERQWLLRLPDVQAMKAVLRIQEALVPRLNVDKKQRATVKIIGVSRPVGATLTKVSVLADSSQRWFNPDLKEYPVELTLDETPPGLKPGIGVQAEIFVDRYEQTLAVPLAALYSVGKDNYVFVHNGNTVNHRKVMIGASNETHAQITDGLSEGEEVLLLQAGQGRTLLEKAGIKVEPTTRPANEEGKGNHGRRNGQGAGPGGSSPRA
ncbi:MAG: HlyD family efflux transporter periplasmic adaptor subunit [Bacillota bacterium]